MEESTSLTTIPQKEKKPKKHKKKFKKSKVIVPLVIVLGAAAFYFYQTNLNEKMARQAYIGSLSNYIPLEKQNIEKSINITGTVESDETKSVYSKLSYPISDVLVEVGDVVSQGDKLCELDTSSIMYDIEQQRASINNTRRTASIDYENKLQSYEIAKSLYDQGLNSDIVSASNALNTAIADLEQKELDYENYLELFELGDISNVELDQYLTNVENAQSAVDKAEATLSSTRKRIELELKNSEAAVKAARASGDTKSMEIGVDKLDSQLDDAVITSPISGTVTTVNATVGNNGNGLLFIVEDLNNLIVKAKVKEYDAPNIVEGLKATIKSDGTGDMQFLGKVKTLAPTAAKDAAGQSTANVEFDADIEVDDASAGLKVGMNARINLLLEKKDSVFALPFETILTREDEKTSYIKVLKEVEANYVVTEIDVVQGIQTDLVSEIFSNELQIGMKVLRNPQDAQTGAIVPIYEWQEYQEAQKEQGQSQSPIQSLT